MKYVRTLVALAALLFTTLPALAQWQVSINDIPMGRGGGKQGFAIVSGRSGGGTKCLIDTSPPAFGTCPGAAPSLTNSHIFVGSGSNVATDVAMSGDATIANTGAISVSKTGGVAFGALATATTAGVSNGGTGINTLAAGDTPCGAGTSPFTAVHTSVGSAQLPLVSNGATTCPTYQQITLNGVAGLGTGVQSALIIAVGSAGAIVTNGGALGTPSSGVGTNLTALNGTNVASGTVANARLVGSGATTVAGRTCTLGSTCGFVTFTNSIVSNVALTTAFADGPSVAQGTSGTWYATGHVTLADTAAVGSFICKLWDGTTVMDSATATGGVTSQNVQIALSGRLASPAANIRISCKDTATTTGLMLASASGLGLDSTVTVLEIN